jgi:hypothetical protein
MTTTVPARLTPDTRALTAAQFQGLAEVPPELEWFANIRNPRTRKACNDDLQDVMRFTGIDHPEHFRRITRRMSLPGATTSPAGSSRQRPSGASWLRSRRCISISVRKTPCS